MSKNLRKGFVFAALVPAMLLGATAAFASGGTVKLKTDNGPDGYYYNAFGASADRFNGKYNGGEFDPGAIICGARYADLDQSTITAGVDDYTLGLDLRSSEGSTPEYADLSGGGLIAIRDANSALSCTTTGNFSTQTFGGGAGVPDPGIQFHLTMPQPANNDPGVSLDFCGILLDTSSVFVNSSRVQGYFLGGFRGSIGFNHFVEAIVFEPKEFDLNIRMTGSSRFAGDRGLPVMFARRRCSGTDCKTDGTQVAVNYPATSDDFITGRFSIDNNTAAAPRPLNLIIEANRAPINPKLGPKDVTAFFKPIGGGPGIMNPVTFPNGRTLFQLEIKIAIKEKFLAAFPVNLPFDVRLQDPNDPNDVPDSESQRLGLRPQEHYYDSNTHTGGFFFSQNPVLTGDAINVKFSATDSPKVGNTLTVNGAQVVGGEFGASGLVGIDAFQVRREDAVLPNNPDLSPQGLLRTVGSVGDPGNADGTAFGLPPTTVNIDFTNFSLTPTNPALSLTLFGMAYLNPGDSPASVTAIGSSPAGDVFIGNSSVLLGNTLPVSAFTQNDLEIRLAVEGQLGIAADNPVTTGHMQNAMLREKGQFTAIDLSGRRID